MQKLYFFKLRNMWLGCSYVMHAKKDDIITSVHVTTVTFVISLSDSVKDGFFVHVVEKR